MPQDGSENHTKQHRVGATVCKDVVWCRLCVAAQAALYAAFPQNFGFIRLALQHRYPLRQLSTPALPFCNLLASYLAEVQCRLVACYVVLLPQKQWRAYGLQLRRVQQSLLTTADQGLSYWRQAKEQQACILKSGRQMSRHPAP